MGGLLGGPKGMLTPPPLKLLGGGGGAGPPWPPPLSSYAYVRRQRLDLTEILFTETLNH